MMKILIFTEGTIIMHKNAVNFSRKEIVKQVKNREESVHDYKSYLPIGKSVEKLVKWQNQGLDIFYLTSRTKPSEINDIRKVLKKYKFPKGELFFRKDHEGYADVAERVIPNILIEDDCESIGGKKEMTITNVSLKIRNKIKSIIVKEFEGIDNLSDDVNKLFIC